MDQRSLHAQVGPWYEVHRIRRLQRVQHDLPRLNDQGPLTCFRRQPPGHLLLHAIQVEH